MVASATQPGLIPAQGYVVARDGVSLYYEIAGSGKKKVVISGGFMLRAALAPLTQHARVVFYDASGRGRSDVVPAERISARHHVTDLEDLRAGLGLEPFVLLGFSGMGKELFSYVAEHPERVAKRMLQVVPVPPVSGDFVEQMMQTRMARVDQEKLAERSLMTRYARAGAGASSGLGWTIMRDDTGAIAWFGHDGETNGAYALVRYFPASKISVAAINNYNVVAREPTFFDAMGRRLPALFSR